MRTIERLEEMRDLVCSGQLYHSLTGANRHIDQLITEQIEAVRILDDVTVVIVDDDHETWMLGLFANPEIAEQHFRVYLVDRFGEEEVAAAEAGENGLADLVCHRFEYGKVVR